MALGTTFANDFAKLIFQAIAIANIADNAASSPLTNLYMSAHTADPGAAGSQTTSEISYTGYARQALLRSASGWTVTGAVVNPLAEVNFGLMTAGAGGTITHIMIGTLVSGAGKQLVRGALSPTLSAVNGASPKVTVASTITLVT